MTGCTSGGYDQLETSPEAFEIEFATCSLRTPTDRLKANYSVDTLFSARVHASIVLMFSRVK